MLAIPEKGFTRSVKRHNVEIGALVDWIEGSALYLHQRVSRSDLVDILCEENLYIDQDFAAELVEDGWAELLRRQRSVSCGFPFDVQSRIVQATHAWRDVAPYTLCLWLSLVRWSPGWRARTDKDYLTQGELFERLTAESMEATGWSVLLTGWSRTRVMALPALVNAVAKHLDEPVYSGGIERWTRARAKDAGLDVVLRLPFTDHETGDPRFLVQCASGADWEGKLATPDIGLWEKLIDFANSPQRGFAMPFCIGPEDRRRSVLRVKGIFLDRLRLTDCEPGWETPRLQRDIRKWLGPRIRFLPTS